MTRMILLLILIALVLIGCNVEVTNNDNEKTAAVALEKSTTDSAINIETPSSMEDSPEYVAKNEKELSMDDSQTAYEMCVRVLTDYYKAVWNGMDINLDAFIDNENLKTYMQKKIQSQHDLHAHSNDPVRNVEIGTRGLEWEVEYTADTDGGFLYLKLPAEINKSVGGFGELTEFLVRNVNGRLVVVDWYTGGKDTYDFLVRGENETIDNPDIWNDRGWVNDLDRKQNEFSGSTR